MVFIFIPCPLIILFVIQSEWSLYTMCTVSVVKNTFDQNQTKTSKFHREFMSPALFLFELLKMGKLTTGPLVLYHLPKY